MHIPLYQNQLRQEKKRLNSKFSINGPVNKSNRVLSLDQASQL